MFLRFHIHPDVKLSATASKKKSRTKVTEQPWLGVYMLRTKIQINEGIYFGGEINKKK